MIKEKYAGSLGLEYAEERETKKALQYRLWRRTHEILLSIEQFAKAPVRDMIDLGTADGKMLEVIHQKYKNARCVGIEYSEDLVNFAKTKFPHLEIAQGDVQSLGFSENSFDVAIAAAVIEHISDPAKMISEVKRILRPGGVFILTSPDPFWEHLATLVGHLKKEQHQVLMDLKQLSSLTSKLGFSILRAQKFMLSPIGLPFEFGIEKIIRNLRMDFLMANQLLVAKL